MSCIDNSDVICTSVQTVLLFAQNNLAIELDSLADIYAVGDYCLLVHDHHRPVNVFGNNSKAGSKNACIVNATVTKADTGQVVILLINQKIEIKGFNHQLLCLMQCCMNGVLINKVPKFLAPFPVRPHMPSR